jgi:TATA-binding protein-associated factor
LQLKNLDLTAVLTYGKKLLGTATKGQDLAIASLEPDARFAHQKETLNARLGLAGEYNESDIPHEENRGPNSRHDKKPAMGRPRVDTHVSAFASQENMQSPSPFTAESPRGLPSRTPTEEGGLSKRQLNQLKRKNKLNAKNQANKVRVVDLSVRRQSSDTPATPTACEPFAVKCEVKSEYESNSGSDMFSLDRSNVDEDTKIISDFKGAFVPEKSYIQSTEGAGVEWPFEKLCEVLAVDLFDSNWEIRHGAAMGLREVIRVHGAGAGRIEGKDRAGNDVLNNSWLDDLACRLCCVLMLDRFGDYVSDNVVAPIRETVGQTLGALLVHLPPESVVMVYNVLHRMVMQDDLHLQTRIWEVCHGGMIGLRYLVAVRTDLLVKDDGLMDGVVEAVTKGLADNDDDVRAVSAATLTPIAKEFVTLRQAALDNLMTIVWDCLSDLRDDLSASTGPVMDLLAKLCSFPEVVEAMRHNAASFAEHSFAQLVPRLYPFLRHTITSVRSAVLRALQTFMRIGGTGTKDWVNGVLLRLVYQNLLVERNESTLALSKLVWFDLADTIKREGSDCFRSEFSPHRQDMFTLALHPIGTSRLSIPMPLSCFIRPSGSRYGPPGHGKQLEHPGAETGAKKRRRLEKKEEPQISSHNIDGHMIQGDVSLVGADTLINSRILACEAFARALAFCGQHIDQEVIVRDLQANLKSPHSSTQMSAAMIIEHYVHDMIKEGCMETTLFSASLRSVLEDDRPESYSDILPYLRVVRAQCHSLLNAFRDHGRVPPAKIPVLAIVVQGESGAGPSAFSLSHADAVVGQDFERLKNSLPPAQKLTSSQLLDEARAGAITAIEEAKRVKTERDIRIKAAASCAIVATGDIPKKPSLLIKGMMDSIKSEEHVELQKRSATSIAALIQHYAQTEKRGPSEKIVGNLMKFYCMETSETPEFFPNVMHETAILSLRKEEDRREPKDPSTYEKEAKAARITRRGAKNALDKLSKAFGSELFTKASALKTKILTPLHLVFDNEQLPPDIGNADNELGQDVVDGLSILRAITPGLDASLHDLVIEWLPLVMRALHSRLSVFRYAAAKCFATICSVVQVPGMTHLIKNILPFIGSIDLYTRQGAIELIYHLIHVMEDKILPYVIFLVVPVLGRMSDSDNDVRLIATTAFATLVKLVPLEAGIPDPPGLPEVLLEGRERERKFISQMLDVRKVEPFEVPVAIKAELRSYQQEGVNWLAFLNRYHLHGILCDDMGLGKTLQTLCIVASDHHFRAEEFAKTKDPESRPVPSLIVCPPTLSGHWQQEIQTYAPFLSCLAYVGSSADRGKIRDKLGKTDVVITSYDVCRNDLDILVPFSWNYLVLDEGHLIKNPKAKTTRAVKQLTSNHRLILSGTPIQNNVLELWSLFDFLMPGFLGTEKVFQDRFAKPIAASRNSKSSSKEQEAGALAIEALHKQVLPFLLRRLKEEVLDDLPPKILQNYYCDLSDLQKLLFENFAKKERKTLAEKAGSDDREAKQHIFQALQYMRKLCNSPALVVKEGHKQYDAIQNQLARQGSTLKDIAHAPKLTALRDLLIDCGIGVDASGGELPSEQQYVSQHRALIFCQMKEMLDIVQHDVLQKLLPTVQFLRLDGSIEANKRQTIVNKFNTDPSFDVLLLTTSVGGLGLNLTGADTVIFVEHDWNPQKDLQAMDRAHRIGQKKVVNVYRLITRGTLEEKILKYVMFSPLSSF